MINIVGYKSLTCLYQSSDTTIFKAIRVSDNKPAILKVSPKLDQDPKYKILYEHESLILKKLNEKNVTGVPEMIEFFQSDNAAVIAMDYLGDSFDHILKDERKTLDTKTFLEVGIKLAEILENIHQQQVIHKDIKPANILIDEDDHVSIIDFNISTLLKRQKESISNKKLLQGTLNYVSPEQTGRTNQLIDLRTDFLTP